MKLSEETTVKRFPDNTIVISGIAGEQRSLTSRASMARSGGLW